LNALTSSLCCFHNSLCIDYQSKKVFEIKNKLKLIFSIYTDRDVHDRSFLLVKVMYSLRLMKSAILVFSDRSVVLQKYYNALICWQYVVCFGMQIKSDHLIRQVVEIQLIWLHSLRDLFSNVGLHLFMRRPRE
jgi:hypothetical protein